MFVCDTIAAILLFAQFVVLRTLALLVIANGYVLTTLVLIPYTPTFPGLVGPGPLIGGLQKLRFSTLYGTLAFPYLLSATLC
jgi:two-component system, sensor histidine kinase and response regulator